MKHPRLSVLSLAVAGALHPAFAPAATTQELEKQLQILARKVKELEGALAESKKVEAAKPAASPAQVQELDQKIKVLERKQDIAEAEAVAKKKETPAFKAGPGGLVFSSADGDFSLKIRGYLQADSRFAMDDTRTGTGNGNITDTFLLRRVRPIFDGTVFKYYDYRIMPDFGTNDVTNNTVLQDAYIETNANLSPLAKLRIGKFKGPIGLERLASATDIKFVERGLPTNLVPNRDIGIDLNGELFDKSVNYSIGYFNGVADGGSNGDPDFTDDKEFEGRIFALPFKNAFSPLQGLGLGIAGSVGDQNGAAGLPSGTGPIPGYKSQGQATIFSYLQAGTGPITNAAIAAGGHYRISPQGYYYWGPFGLLGEYVDSTQRVSRNDPTSKLTDRQSVGNDSWQIVASYVLTGEDNGYKSIIPKNKFDPFSGGWGAWELVGRYDELDVDDDAFTGITPSTGTTAAKLAARQATRLANPFTSVTEAWEWGIGVNWYLNSAVKLAADYEQTDFKGGGGVEGGGAEKLTSTPDNRETEKVFFTRVQLSY
ncbi:MAG TPA: porin [Gammaproteobacteria bacterium]|nr:porin [Gammaproteobacteria bacterium]